LAKEEREGYILLEVFMSDPMSLFENESRREKGKIEKSSIKDKKQVLDNKEEKEISDSWKEQLGQIREEWVNRQNKAKEIAEKYGMTTQEFENYLDNRENFSEEEWEIMEEVRMDRKNFMKEMQDILGEFVKTEMHKKRKVSRGPGKNWIPVE
jgi:hypothetical protein